MKTIERHIIILGEFHESVTITFTYQHCVDKTAVMLPKFILRRL